LKPILLIALFIGFSCCALFSQIHAGARFRVIILPLHENRLDSLSIVPGSVILTGPDHNLIADSLYQVDYSTARFIPHPFLNEHFSELFITYRVFGFSLERDYFLRDTANIFLGGIRQVPPLRDARTRDFSAGEEESLISSGSISRGISIGNRQDLFLNSQMNLQLSGRLTENLNIEAVISDNNIPLQPEGYSQTIQEFDRVYISIYNEELRLTAGDFFINDDKEHFFRLNRKAQGVLFSGQFDQGADSGKVYTSVSASVARGRFTRNNLRVTEGNQGPYRLTGENNELFIIVLAGSEKVYIDGKLMERGADRDYVIDYNLAEIVFTPNQPVNRNKRVVVEFEYSDRNYPRFMAYTSNRIERKRSSFHLGFYTEQDAKNQPLQQALNREDIDLLSSIGDSLHLAFVPRIDQVEFSNQYVLYRKTDSLVNTSLYPDVYVFSTDPEQAHYRLNFTFVGENQGNYVPESSSANGRVFRWVAPEGGVSRGTHEPVVFLATPKKNQLLGMSASQKIGASYGLHLDAALSNRDLNTFSSLDSDDNAGMAFRIVLEKPSVDSDSVGLQTSARLGYEMTGRNFATVERFRSVEFERDWNILPAGLTGNQHHLFAQASLNSPVLGLFDYSIGLLDSDDFRGLKNTLLATNSFLGFHSSFQGSFLTTSVSETETRFFRHQLDLSRNLSYFQVGFISGSEQNTWQEGQMELNARSFKNADLAVYLKNSGSKENSWRMEARQRKDFLPSGGDFDLFSISRDATALLSLSGNRDHSFRGRVNYRTVDYKQFSDSISSESSFSGRLEYSGRFFDGVLVSSSFLETLSGREQKKDFFYLEVPAGQGQFKWVDYNGNGLKELDEFELAGFPDEGTHIRVFVPTNQWLRTQVNQAGQTLTLSPAVAWRNQEGIRRFLSRLHNTFSFRTSQKILNGSILDLPRMIDLAMGDSSLVSLNAGLRNTLIVNRNHPRIGAEYTLTKNWTKTLLFIGDEQKTLVQHIFRLRWNPGDGVSLFPRAEWGDKSNTSGFFPGRNFVIRFTNYEMMGQYQPEPGILLKATSSYSRKKNQNSPVMSSSLDLRGEITYSLPASFQLNSDITFAMIRFEGAENSPLAYEMLEGLFPGRNLIWNVFLQKSLPNNLEISVTYGGRFSSGRDIIHTGGLQARAYF
jgi:hypothetical protein